MVKKIINVILIISLLILLIMTIYKINKSHENKLYQVLYEEIKYQSKRCYLEKKCESSMTLEELYSKEYLDIQYDPISKEELNKDLEIIIKDNKVTIK